MVASIIEKPAEHTERQVLITRCGLLRSKEIERYVKFYWAAAAILAAMLEVLIPEI